MLENVKTLYFIKIIFSYVNERNKLKIAKYSKSLQNNLDINLINYKFFSGRYIIYEKNGKGKEFIGFNNQLLYEGEYLNGKRHGKGKEYDRYSGNLIYEGEYFNGKKMEKEDHITQIIN